LEADESKQAKLVMAKAARKKLEIKSAIKLSWPKGGLIEGTGEEKAFLFFVPKKFATDNSYAPKYGQI
jgi:hypothetical protein